VSLESLLEYMGIETDLIIIETDDDEGPIVVSVDTENDCS
jgi:hypothetical protein